MWDLQFEVNELEGLSMVLFSTRAECEIIQEKYIVEVVNNG